MWAVHADAMTSQTQQSLLLCIRKRDRLEASEYNWVVCNDDRRVERNGFIRDSFRKVDSEKDVVRLATRRNERSFQEQASVIPRVVCQSLRVAVRRQ